MMFAGMGIAPADPRSQALREVARDSGINVNLTRDVPEFDFGERPVGAMRTFVHEWGSGGECVIELAHRWSEELHNWLEVITRSEVFRALGIATIEMPGEDLAGAIRDVDVKPSTRVIAAMKVSVLASIAQPNEIFDSLWGVMTNSDEGDLLRLASLYSFTALMTSDTRYTLGYDQTERGARIVYNVACNPDNSILLRSAATSSLGVMSKTWCWGFPVIRDLAKLFTSTMMEGHDIQLRIASLRAFGVLYGLSYLDDVENAIQPLQAMASDGGRPELQALASELLDVMKSGMFFVASPTLTPSKI